MTTSELQATWPSSDVSPEIATHVKQWLEYGPRRPRVFVSERRGGPGGVAFGGATFDFGGATRHSFLSVSAGWDTTAEAWLLCWGSDPLATPLDLYCLRQPGGVKKGLDASSGAKLG